MEDEKRPIFWRSKPNKCRWCGYNELVYESSGRNLSGVLQDYYRCKRCFRVTCVQ